MTVITVKDQSPTEQILSSLKTWRRDAKKNKQTALYDLLSEVADHIRKQEKSLNDSGKKVFEEFTHTPADAAFSDYIRARAGYWCERCGKQYEAKSNGLQCSHHFSRRHYNIRFDPDNAAALNLKDQDRVSVRFGGERGARLDNFLIRVKDSYLAELHLDTDEGNAVGARTGDYVTICLDR